MKPTEVGEDVCVLVISRWDDVAIMDVGRVSRMGVEYKLARGEFGMMDTNYFLINISLNFSIWFRKVILKTFMGTSVAREQH